MTYLDSKEDIRNSAGGPEIDTDVSKFSQLYNIEFQRQIFPYVDFRTGLVLERDKINSTTEDLRSQFTDATRTYFVELFMKSPGYQAGLTYRDTEDERDGTNLPDLEIFREEYSGFFHWRTDTLPSVDLNYRHSKAHDKPKTRESVLDFLNLNSRYEYNNLGLQYTYTRVDVDERVEDSGSLDLLHDGAMEYTTTIFGGRAAVTGTSQLTYRVSDPSGGAVARLVTSPPQGSFFLLDDSTPGSNAPGEFTTVTPANPLTTVDIGPSGPPNLVSFGVQYSSPTSVDTIYVLPLEDPTDPSLASPGEIDAVADLFVWQVFSSDDQETWTELTVTRATYEVFENRFEISFTALTNARFVKAVTQPLSGGATRSILISQLQTFETAAGRPGATVRSFRQIYGLGLRSELTPDTDGFYEAYYQIEDLDPSEGQRTLLTNSIGLRHQFGPKLVGSTRFLRTVSRRPDNDGIQNSYVASLRADHLDTFYQTLTYSSLHDRDDNGSTNTNSVWLRNGLELHPSWSMSLDMGYVRNSQLERPTTYGPTLRLVSSLAPNRRTQLNLDYWFTLTKEKHKGTLRQHRWDVRAFFVPTDALSLFADLSYNDDGLVGHELSQDYSVNWTPFREGDLDLSLTYRRFKNRTGRDSETLTPELRWQLRRGLLGILRYTFGSEDTETQKRDINVFSAELQFSFR
jgi:hypothetical protein